MEERAFTPEEAKRWFRLVYMHYFPVNILGGANQRRLFRRIKILFEQPRTAELSIHFISKYIQIESIPWLEASLDQDSKTTCMAKLITVIMGTMLKELSNTFYLTENSKNKNLFWHKFEWKDSTMEHINLYLNGGGLVSVSHNAQKLFKTDGPAEIRFIPSGDKFKMVMPLNRQILNSRSANGSPLDTNFQYKGVNLTTGEVILRLFKHLIGRINNDLVVNTDSIKLLNNRIKTFLFENHQREIHGIQLNIENCYNSLPIKSVIKLCKREISRFAENNSHIQYDFDVKMGGHTESDRNSTPTQWKFSPSNGWENRRLPSIPVQTIISWLDSVPMLPIRHYNNIFNYQFMPYSLLITKVAVGLYLQSKSVKMTSSDEFKNAPFIACRTVNDIIILSADEKLCYTFYKSLADLVTLNDRNTICSMHIDPNLNTKETINFNIAGLALSADLKTVSRSPPIDKQPIKFKDPLQDIPETIHKSLSGLLRWFCSGNIAPVSIVTNPWLLQDDFLAYAENIFTTLIIRFYCIRSHLDENQRDDIKPEFLVELMRIATSKIKHSFLQSIRASPIKQDLKKILRGLTWKLTVMARTKAIWQTSKNYQKFPEMQKLKKKMISKRPPKPKFDDKWNMEIWSKVSSRFKPVANKKKIVENLKNEL